MLHRFSELLTTKNYNLLVLLVAENPNSNIDAHWSYSIMGCKRLTNTLKKVVATAIKGMKCHTTLLIVQH